MSQENVEIVKAIQPPTGTDLTALYERPVPELAS